MLFDARRALHPARQLLLDAAEYIMEHGWCQHRMNVDKQSCVLGAIIRVAGREVDVAKEAARLLDKRISSFGRIAAWNDAPGRTKEEVITALEDTAWQ